MKFNSTHSTDRKIIAYMTQFGSLKVRNPFDPKKSLMLETDGDISLHEWSETYAKDATRKFYEGDSVTITF